MTAAPANPLLDRAVGLHHAGGDAVLYRELLGVFLGDVPRLLGLLDAAAARPADLGHALHSLKGSASIIGAIGIAQQALALEKQVQADPAAPSTEPLRLVRADLLALARHLDTEINALSPPESP